jgi:hypothetical protein
METEVSILSSPEPIADFWPESDESTPHHTSFVEDPCLNYALITSRFPEWFSTKIICICGIFFCSLAACWLRYLFSVDYRLFQQLLIFRLHWSGSSVPLQTFCKKSVNTESYLRRLQLCENPKPQNRVCSCITKCGTQAGSCRQLTQILSQNRCNPLYTSLLADIFCEGQSSSPKNNKQLHFTV